MQPRPSALEIDCHQSRFTDRVTIVHLRGPLETHNYGELAAILDRLLAEKKYYLAIEMSCLTFISSAAVGTLMGYRRRLAEKNGSLVLVGAAPEMKTKLSLMGADKVFRFFSNIRSAVHQFNWEHEKREENVQISFPASLLYVPAIRRFISQVALQKGYHRKDTFRIETIVDELCNNAVEHGCLNERSEYIRVSVGINRDQIDLSIVNRTNPQKVESLKEYMTVINEQKLVPTGSRGRGLALVQKLARDLTVDISDSGTNVHVTKLREG